jgi:hypothetical protein
MLPAHFFRDLPRQKKLKGRCVRSNPLFDFIAEVQLTLTM